MSPTFVGVIIIHPVCIRGNNSGGFYMLLSQLYRENHTLVVDLNEYQHLNYSNTASESVILKENAL